MIVSFRTYNENVKGALDKPSSRKSKQPLPIRKTRMSSKSTEFTANCNASISKSRSGQFKLSSFSSSVFSSNKFLKNFSLQKNQVLLPSQWNLQQTSKQIHAVTFDQDLWRLQQVTQMSSRTEERLPKLRNGESSVHIYNRESDSRTFRQFRNSTI